MHPLTSPPHPSRDAQMLIEDVKRIVHELDQGQQLSSIGVELVDNELAILYMNSKKSEVMLTPHLKACSGSCSRPFRDWTGNTGCLG